MNQKANTTQRDYCKSKNIPFGRFKNQTYKLGISGRESSFKAIKISNPKEEKHPYCEIKFEGGNQIIIENRESLMYLKQLIRSIAQS